MTEKFQNGRKICIIGAGLVGCLCGCYLANRGYLIDIYEFRNDIRKEKSLRGRSINLALSSRGLNALKHAKISEDSLNHLLVPMRGRMIHSTDGSLHGTLYDPKNQQCTFSVGRNHINELLLNELEKYPNAKIHFCHKLINADLQAGQVNVLSLKENTEKKESYDLIIGCDGSYSTTRQLMIKTPLFNYSQKYIDHGYMELVIPREKSEMMVKEHLHIWPRHEFMMIALPNNDQSWTVTLFMPFQEFHRITNPDELIEFFQNNFKDALPLIGSDDLINMFFASKPQPLISIKCGQYHVGSKALLLGDSAHAVVPFYGQGMNAGFEDCFILNEMLDECEDNIGETIDKFSKIRTKDCYAISHLSMYNYIEMRSLVISKGFRLRKMLDNNLYNIFGNHWLPLYMAVTFSRLPYSECLRSKQTQDKIINVACSLVIFAVAILIIYYIFY